MSARRAVFVNGEAAAALGAGTNTFIMNRKRLNVLPI